jgi:hypothetical protein
MLKHAFQLGMKLAMEEAGLDPERANPAEQLATIFQLEPDVDGSDPDDDETEPIGKPKKDSSFGHSSTESWGNDTLSNLGLDCRGPVSTSV